MSCCFVVEFNEPEEMPEQLRLFFEDSRELDGKDQAYMEEKYARIMEKLPEIDRLLGEAAKSWKVSRMGKTDLALLRLAVYEMKYDEDVPVAVASERGGGAVERSSAWRRISWRLLTESLARMQVKMGEGKMLYTCRTGKTHMSKICFRRIIF